MELDAGATVACLKDVALITVTPKMATMIVISAVAMAMVLPHLASPSV
jgi:hypothetical protein